MSIMPPGPDSNTDAAPTAWTDEIRRAAVIAVRLAVHRHTASERVLRYYLNTAASHGLTTDELADTSGLHRDEVLRLTQPAVA